MVKIIPYCTITGGTVWNSPYGMDELHPDCVALKLLLTKKISELCNLGIFDFFTTCEYGLPLWAAEVIVGARSFRFNPPRLHIVVPHENQAALWNDEARERYYNVHSAADTIIMLNSQYHDDCYKRADKFMFNHSVILLTDGGGDSAAELAKSEKFKHKHIELLNIQV